MPVGQPVLETVTNTYIYIYMIIARDRDRQRQRQTDSSRDVCTHHTGRRDRWEARRWTGRRQDSLWPARWTDGEESSSLVVWPDLTGQ